MSDDIESSSNAIKEMKESMLHSTWGQDWVEHHLPNWIDANGFLTGILPVLAEYPNMSQGKFQVSPKFPFQEITATRLYQANTDYDDVQVSYIKDGRCVIIRHCNIHIYPYDEISENDSGPLWNYRAFLNDSRVEHLLIRKPEGLVRKVQNPPAFLNYLLLRATTYSDAVLWPTFVMQATSHLHDLKRRNGLKHLEHYRCRAEHYDWLERFKEALVAPLPDAKARGVVNVFSEEFQELTRHVVPIHERKKLERLF